MKSTIHLKEEGTKGAEIRVKRWLKRIVTWSVSIIVSGVLGGRTFGMMILRDIDARNIVFIAFIFLLPCLAGWFLEEKISRKLASAFVVIVISFFTFSVVTRPYYRERLFMERAEEFPRPEITSGEFPFRLEYELDGEHHVIEDTLLAEFDGIVGALPTPGAIKFPVRRWRGTLLYNDEYIDAAYVVYPEISIKQTEDIQIGFSPGIAEWYMGDISVLSAQHVPHFKFSRVEIGNGQWGSIRVHVNDKDHELFVEHGITIIRWEYTPPIVNHFE